MVAHRVSIHFPGSNRDDLRRVPEPVHHGRLQRDTLTVHRGRLGCSSSCVAPGRAVVQAVDADLPRCLPRARTGFATEAPVRRLLFVVLGVIVDEVTRERAVALIIGREVTIIAPPASVYVHEAMS